MDVGGVVGRKPTSAISSTARQSNAPRGRATSRQRAIARSLTQAIARPGGSIRPFWLPQTATSTPHSSNRKSMLPSPLIVSTTRSAGCRAASIAARTAARSDVTPVDVSLWTTVTARTAWSRSAWSRS